MCRVQSLAEARTTCLGSEGRGADGKSGAKGKLPRGWYFGWCDSENAETDFGRKGLFRNPAIRLRQDGEQNRRNDLLLTRSLILGGFNGATAPILARVAAFIRAVRVAGAAEKFETRDGLDSAMERQRDPSEGQQRHHEYSERPHNEYMPQCPMLFKLFFRATATEALSESCGQG
jgi:hypothetical protein